ncbi:hypothetical protein Q1695_010877 [Nippostrongylus brasiliensis]|nr:hypothetical protein Q1695_010877 [Nippostrongylus brasiliensis]
MSGPLRKVPRIMAKSNRTTRTVPEEVEKRDRSVEVEDVSIRTSELDDDHEQLLVRDGMVVGLQQPNGRFVDEAGVQVPSSVMLSYPRTRRIVIESSTDNTDDYEPYVPNALPGVADEVESYPCPLCPERVFLTSFGLERHSAERHPGHVQQIIDHIETISSEWRRREEELARRRDRMYSSRVRQENIARHAIEQVTNGTLIPESVHGHSSDGLADGAEGSADPNEPLKERRYKSCNSCGMLIDAESSAAMESHMRAHKKNDDLKRRLLARYGPEEVNRLMCRDCNMVFCDDNSLLAHNDQMHTRRRKYVCKWCGHVSHTMTELNVHKADVHAMPPYTMKSDRDRILRKRHMHNRGLIALGANPRQNEIEDRHGSTHPHSSEALFRTTCEQCGLRLVRPSLLVRHMLRVHSKSSFSCEIETSSSSNYRIAVDCDRITWICCGSEYSTRREFLLHRINNHLEKVVDGASSTEFQPCETAAHNLDRDMVVVPDTIQSDGSDYFIVVGNGDQGGDEEILVSDPSVNEGELVAISTEQYEQLRLLYGDMDVIFVNEEPTGDLRADDDTQTVQPL